MSVLVCLLPNCIIKHSPGSVMWSFVLRGWITAYIIGFDAQRTGDILNRLRPVRENNTAHYKNGFQIKFLTAQGSQVFTLCTNHPFMQLTYCTPNILCILYKLNTCLTFHQKIYILKNICYWCLLLPCFHECWLSEFFFNVLSHHKCRCTLCLCMTEWNGKLFCESLRDYRTTVENQIEEHSRQVRDKVVEKWIWMYLQSFEHITELCSRNPLKIERA